MSWTNVALWNAQIALLAAAATALAAVFRLRPAPARLAYWQAVLALCLLLPLVQPWRRETVVLPPEPPAIAAAVAVPAPARRAAPRPVPFPWSDAAVAVLAAGVLLRAGWFALGLLRLQRYRRAARLLHPLPLPLLDACRLVGAYPEIALSGEIPGPVTFGFRNPVILLPARILDLEPEVQSAVASHELMHVRRRDWLFATIEEMVRAVFWFHPAVWWMLGQIQLAREQSVDRAVVKLSQSRERYVDALLALSGARTQLDLAPAPLFLRRRHLTARVAAILREADMSKRRLSGTLAACAGGLLLAGWMVCARLPLEAAPQYVQDAPGVTVTGADRMIHRNAVPYPAEAREKNIEGTLVLDVQVAADGTVTDATVLTGPQELRAATIKSMLGWHFRADAVGRQQVIVEFKAGGGSVARGETTIDAIRAGAEPAKPLPLDRVVIRGLSQVAEEELRRRLNLQEGQIVDIRRVQQIVREFDAHLTVIEGLVRKSDATGAAAPPSMAIMIQPAPGTAVNPDHAPAAGEAPRDLSSVPRKLTRIEITGMAPEAAEELRRRLPVKEGDNYDSAVSRQVQETVKAFDPQLGIVMGSKSPSRPGADGNLRLPELIELSLLIRRPPTVAPSVDLSNVTRKLRRIQVRGLAPEAEAELRRRLPFKEDDIIDTDGLRRIEEAVRAFDPHLTSNHGISVAGARRMGPDGKALPPEALYYTILIAPADNTPLEQFGMVQSAPAPDFPPPPPGVQRIRVGGQVQAAKLKQPAPRPVYLDEARQARIQGVVRLNALIDSDGNMKSFSVIGGHPVLVPAAMEAVKQWQYEKTFLNGVPVEVVTQVDVNFTLSQ